MPFSVGISGAIIVSGHNGYRPFVGSLGVEDGKIAWVGERPLTGEDAALVVDARGKILMPGLVNGHCHGDMTLAKGLGDGMTLPEQGEAFADTNWFYSRITDQDRYWSRQLTYVEALLSGTTFLLENMYWSLGKRSVEAMTQVGIRGGLVEDIHVDFARPDVLVKREMLEGFCRDCAGADLVPVVAGPSEEGYDAWRVEQWMELTRGLPCLRTCHLAENTFRRELIRKRYNTTSVAWLEDRGALDDRLIGSHVVQVTGEDIERMARRGVRVVNTPLCEMKIRDGAAPIAAMVEAGIPVGLGTDGALWNNSNDIFREMKGMMLLSTLTSGIRSLSVQQVLDMATVGGAAVFGREKRSGTLEPGKDADFILVDATAPHMRPLRWEEAENVTSQLVFCATGRDVTDVFVGGQRLVEERHVMTVNVEEIACRVEEASRRIAREAGLPGKND